MAVTVKITETYDMKTTVNKIGVVGVHTPSVALVKKLYPGLLKNHRFIRFVKCDVVGACASVLPADPLQVGVAGGEIAPEDMFNPILYTAVSNTSFDTIVARIRACTDVTSLNSVNAGELIDVSDAGVDNMFKTYYALLAENGKYRKVMPQSGFSIKGLVPLCHTILSTFGNVAPQGNDMVLGEDGETPVAVPNMDIPEANVHWAQSADHAVYLRGRAVKMPKFPIHFSTGVTIGEGIDTVPTPNVPKTEVLAMILPPARLHEFYYRMRVSWTIRFENVISTLEAGNFGVFTGAGALAHGQNYSFSSSKSDMDVSTDMIDGDGVAIDKIMES